MAQRSSQSLASSRGRVLIGGVSWLFARRALYAGGVLLNTNVVMRAKFEVAVRMAELNNFVQAIPICAFLLSLSLVPGAPDDNRLATSAHERDL